MLNGKFEKILVNFSIPDANALSPSKIAGWHSVVVGCERGMARMD